MKHPLRAAVIATHNRPFELRNCIASIQYQVNYIEVIDNASEPPIDYRTQLADLADPRECVITLSRDEEQPPNLSRLWNRGLTAVADTATSLFSALREEPRWWVAVLNDDAVVPSGWFDAVTAAMEATGAVAGCNDPFDRMESGQTYLHGPDGPPGLYQRLAGWAMVLRGEWSGARFDETMRWNFSDDDISYRARQEGGLVYVGGFQVLNTLADTSTRGVLAEQSGRDRAAFVAKHGVQPW